VGGGQKERLSIMAKAKKRTTAVAEVPTAARYEELKTMLLERQREILNEVQGKIRDVRAEGSEKPHEVLDPGETSEVDIQEDIEFALIQMKAETLNKINEALSRLEEGTYGRCFECGEEIAQPRLRALPFAVRCKDCEEAREMAQQRERIQARRGSSTLGFDMRG
jgi:DnaK suppressor protein